MKLKVLVVDDNPAVLRQLVYLLEAEFVMSTAESGPLALESIGCYEPDIVVLDLGMPFLNGLEVTRELRKLGPNPAVVICTVEQDPEIIEAARQAGALAYVFKMHMDRDLIRAVNSASRGEFFVSSP